MLLRRERVGSTILLKGAILGLEIVGTVVTSEEREYIDRESGLSLALSCLLDSKLFSRKESKKA